MMMHFFPYEAVPWHDEEDERLLPEFMDKYRQHAVIPAQFKYTGDVELEENTDMLVPPHLPTPLVI